jgi:nitrite reductase/ring-hydroxylating ferredoxin subunit/uncharacterized membrane protein
MNELSARLSALVHRLEELEALDSVGRAVRPLVARLTSDDAAKRALSGATIGHRLHPLLTDVPIGCWTAASLVDAFAWRSGERASRRLVATGIVAAVPTVATGLSDWDDTYGPTRRIGLAHMLCNTAALTLQVSSWRARRRGHHVRGALLGLGGLAAVTAGGYLGGHLVYVARAGVDHDVPVVDAEGWRTACRTSDIVESTPLGVTIDGARVVLVRRDHRVYALAAVCSHAGGPLDEGDVHDDAITCPWHGSTFCLADGRVERGPATTRQPVYETRVRGDMIELRVTAEGTKPLHAVV